MGAERQFAFLTRLGMEDVTWQKMAINLLIGVAIVVGIFALLMLRRLYTQTHDPAQTEYLKFCRKLARAGVQRSSHEGPQDFAARAIASLPQHAEAINDITTHYQDLRYENHADTNGLRALRRAVRAFKL